MKKLIHTAPGMTRTGRRRFVGSVLMLLTILGLNAAPIRAAFRLDQNTPTVTIPKLKKAPELEDFLSMGPRNGLAEKMACVTGFTQEAPYDGQPATQKTKVYLGYTDSHLYVVFVAFDSEPDKIRAHMSRRENVFNDDIIEIMLDTFDDQRRAYAFIANPFGIQWDAIWTEGKGFDSSFDTVWDSRGTLTDTGYVVWMAIPFHSIRFPSKDKQTWGLILNRTIPRINENDFWPRVSSRIEGRLNQAARMTGIHGITAGRNMQMIPYAVFRSFRALEDSDYYGPRWVSKAAEFDAGVDAKFVFRDSLVFDVAANPDFSQVEADSPQVTVNQRFEVYFPEKRPFFLENAGYFETPINLVFTRRIADPSFGLRLTGKAGPYAIGAMFMDDQSPGKIAAPDDRAFGSRAWYGIFRVNRDIFDQSSIGVIYTNRKHLDGYNRVGGIDGRFKLTANWVASFQAVASSTRTIDGDTLAGPAYEAHIARQGRSFEYSASYHDYSAGFVSEPGFIRRTDYRNVENWAQYRFRPESGILISWGPEIYVSESWDHENTRLDWDFSPAISWELVGETRFGFDYHNGHERLRPEDFDALSVNRDYSTHNRNVFFNSRYFEYLSFNASYNWGTGINYIPPEGFAPILADRTSSNIGLTIQPGTSLRIDNTYLFSRLKSRQDGSAIFNNHIFRSRWNWQFTPEMSMRIILQYNTTLANPDLTDLSTTKSINADLLFTYMLNPGTALFVGYNHNGQNLNLLHTPDGDELIRTRDGFINDSRQFFVKISYLFRL